MCTALPAPLWVTGRGELALAEPGSGAWGYGVEVERSGARGVGSGLGPDGYVGWSPAVCAMDTPTYLLSHLPCHHPGRPPFSSGHLYLPAPSPLLLPPPIINQSGIWTILFPPGDLFTLVKDNPDIFFGAGFCSKYCKGDKHHRLVHN